MELFTQRSFKPEFSDRPARYRTPSPPRAAVEPLSPPPPQWQYRLPAASFRKRKFERYNDDIKSPPSALDVFAAVATSPSLNVESPTFSPRDDGRQEGRASKRSKSEVFVQRPFVLNEGRPITSHVPASRAVNNPGVLEQDAELLLMFARGPHNPRLDIPLAEGHRLDIPLVEAHRLDIPLIEAHQSRHSKPLLPGFGGGEETVLDHYTNTTAATSTAATAAMTAQETKPREHRGWPKGKPRGPRVPGAGRKKAEKARTGDATTKKLVTAPTIPEITTQPRRHSFSTAAASVETPSSQRRRRHSAPSDPYAGLVSAASSAAKMASAQKAKPRKRKAADIEFCSLCQQSNQSGFQDLWINCDGCKAWIHAACAGFENEKKVKEVDKYYCMTCEKAHGPTTYVRKSSRAHASIDYAGLNEGKVQTAEDVVGHHYIEPIKNGSLQFQPETFPRMPPELVTADYFANTGGWTEPILIPAALNPRPDPPSTSLEKVVAPETTSPDACTGDISKDFSEKYDYECVLDDGQDKLDMVIPYGLTVRRVADLHGPEEKLDVIDVKLQEGEDKRWSLSQWADYYEADGEKPVRNVISLEVSQSALGRLIRRPKVVRDLDLQDSVWPAEETAKGIYPRVQFYCLMSVADCYTDFHIDFGGSSVYYHILKGRKTFFFIPPKPKYLKKYEEWCNSPDQNSVFLGNETKECYRVDLYPGDTMLIPSGWIHAVWTPEDSLVIGGNFLTRLHYGMQISVNEIEKATNVPRKFRYPSFQRILWLAAVRYLEQDPLPVSVAEKLCAGQAYHRTDPVWYDLYDCDIPDAGHVAVEQMPEPLQQTSNISDSMIDPLLMGLDAQPARIGQDPVGARNARHYPEAEIAGLGELVKFLHRTLLVSMGKIPNIPKKTQEAVTRSIPKDSGDPSKVLRTFALWTAWKRGNELIPNWAYPGAALAESEAATGEKLPAPTLKPDQQAILEAYKLDLSRPEPEVVQAAVPPAPTKADVVKATEQQATNEPRKAACEDCRRRRRRCMHNGRGDATATPARRLSAKTAGEVGIKSEGFSIGAIDPALSMLPMALSNVSVATPTTTTAMDASPNSGSSKRPKTRACSDCKKSKRRCVHDENGGIDPIKAQETPLPRGSAGTKRPTSSRPSSSKKTKTEHSDFALFPSASAVPSAAVMANVFDVAMTSPEESNDTGRSRTSSSNHHMSSSDSVKSAVSPVTEPESDGAVAAAAAASAPAPEAAATTAPPAPAPVTARQETPRQRKQVERYTDNSASATKKSPSDRAVVNGVGRKIVPAGEVTSLNGSPQRPSQQKPKTPSASVAAAAAAAASAIGGEPEEEEEEESDESLRLARMLASQEHGLRRRG